MNRNETLQLLGVLKMLDRQDKIELNDVTIDLWASLFADIPFLAGQKAVTWWMHNQKWFPAPVEIRDLVLDQVCNLPTAEAARKQIERSMRLNYPGMPAKYTPDRVVLDAVKEIGGIYVFRVAQSEHETRELWRRFAARYDDLRRERAETVDIAEEWQALNAGATDGTPALAGQNGARS